MFSLRGFFSLAVSAGFISGSFSPLVAWTDRARAEKVGRVMNEHVYIRGKSLPGRASISRERPGRKIEKKRIKVLGEVEESTSDFLRVYISCFSCIYCTQLGVNTRVRLAAFTRTCATLCETVPRVWSFGRCKTKRQMRKDDPCCSIKKDARGRRGKSTARAERKDERTRTGKA